MNIRAVIFDYGEVLCHYPTPDEIGRMASVFQVSPQEFPELYMRNRGLYDRGDLTAEAYWMKFAQDAGKEIDGNLIEKLRMWDVEMWSTVNAEMMKWVKDLRSAGIKTAILSNMPEDMAIHARKNFHWLTDFDCHVFSCEIGVIKPNPRIYQHCLEGLNVHPSEALFIDDREANVQGAREVGIHGIQFQSSGQLSRELREMGFPTELVS
ncbi:MAG TPA: HAD family phosphatase [Terriglobales bacterium]|nr:HAD family phosphatase [Terriglobales bacterium]